MTPSVIIQLDHPAAHIQPGETLHGTYRLVDIRFHEIQRLEFSVLWFTEGKGDEDLGVHHFESIRSEEETAFQEFVRCYQESQTVPFAVPLPLSPLSYYGLILKIRWCVRVRVYMKNGREWMSEKLFTIGNLPPVTVTLN
ncbi:MAG: hypothetical protein Q4D62_04445 [Planctomycetia bacterium]|nr:hypothetical protein [Planctomycetia bacterium]